MKMSKVLRMARERVAERELAHTCIEVKSLEALRVVPVRDARRAVAFIRQRLWFSTLEGWLICNVPESGPVWYDSIELFRARVKATRLAWIDSMIAERQAAGD